MMAKTDIDRIYDELQLIRERIDGMLLHGCAKAPEHADHEARLRILEEVRQKQVGFLAAAALVGSALTALLTWVGKIIISVMASKGTAQ